MAKQVLIVDDAPDFVEVVECLLPEFELIIANNGLDALSKLTANPDVALIITDFNMSPINGLSLIQILRVYGTHTHTPVILCSSDSQPEKLADKLSISYINKSNAFRELRAHVLKTLNTSSTKGARYEHYC